MNSDLCDCRAPGKGQHHRTTCTVIAEQLARDSTPVVFIDAEARRAIDDLRREREER